MNDICDVSLGWKKLLLYYLSLLSSVAHFGHFSNFWVCICKTTLFWKLHALTSFVFFNLYAFILLTSTLVPGINYLEIITHPLHILVTGSEEE